MQCEHYYSKNLTNYGYHVNSHFFFIAGRIVVCLTVFDIIGRDRYECTYYVHIT